MAFHDIVDTSGGGSGGSVTLQQAYNNGTADGTAGTIAITSARGPIIINDAATPVAGGALIVNTNAGETLFQVGAQTAGGTRLESRRADGAGVKGIDFVSSSLSNSTALIASFSSGFQSDISQITTRGAYKQSGALAIGTAQTPGATFENTTAAANNAQQFSPMLELVGRGWETTGGTSVAVACALQCRPVQGTTNRPELVFWYKFNGGGSYTEVAKLASPDGASVIFRSTLADLYLRDSSNNGFAMSNGAGRIAFQAAGANTDGYIRISSGQLGVLAGNTQTTVGAAGAASALPANPTGYFKIDNNGTTRVVPYYAAA